MQESQHLPGKHKTVPDLMDDEVIVCDTCGDEGVQPKLIVCCKCHVGAEHTYCNNNEFSKIKVELVHKDWICQECMPRKGTNKLVEDEVEVALINEERHSPLCKDVILKDNFTWLGKFQIHNNEGIARTCDGIQPYLSVYASVEVFKVANRLPDIIILEELPRIKIFPFQFVENQVSENDIGLYFFTCDDDSYKRYEQLMDYMTKNDLALKGNFDGVELLIFSSNTLLKTPQCWNKMSFWGVLREQNVKNLSATTASKSLKLKNGNVAKSLSLNARLLDGYDMEIVDEIPKYNNIGGLGQLRNKVLQVEENVNRRGELTNAEHEAIATMMSKFRSETPENDSTKINNNNVEVPPISSSFTPPSTIFEEMVIGLIFISQGNR